MDGASFESLVAQATPLLNLVAKQQLGDADLMARLVQKPDVLKEWSKMPTGSEKALKTVKAFSKCLLALEDLQRCARAAGLGLHAPPAPAPAYPLVLAAGSSAEPPVTLATPLAALRPVGRSSLDAQGAPRRTKEAGIQTVASGVLAGNEKRGPESPSPSTLAVLEAWQTERRLLLKRISAVAVRSIRLIFASQYVLGLCLAVLVAKAIAEPDWCLHVLWTGTCRLAGLLPAYLDFAGRRMTGAPARPASVPAATVEITVANQTIPIQVQASPQPAGETPASFFGFVLAAALLFRQGAQAAQ